MPKGFEAAVIAIIAISMAPMTQHALLLYSMLKHFKPKRVTVYSEKMHR